MKKTALKVVSVIFYFAVTVFVSVAMQTTQKKIIAAIENI